MGNVQAFVNYNTELTFTSDLNDQIQCCGTIFHPAFGNIQLWKMKKNTNLELFSFTRHLYFQDSILLTIHSKRNQLQHPNLLQYYACTQNSPQYCGSVETQQFYFEYISQTLSQYLCARSEPFREIEVWKSLEQLVSVLKYLQNNGQSHGQITSDHIFITSDQTLKTLDQITIQSTDQQIKQDVYDLAQVIVELMTKKKFHASLKETVISLSADYSQQLLQVLARMLNQNPEKRPDFIELSYIIFNRQYKSTNKELEVTLNPSINKTPDNPYYPPLSQMINDRNKKTFNQNLQQRQLSPYKMIPYSPQRMTPKQFSPSRIYGQTQRVAQPQRVVQAIKKQEVYSPIKQSLQQLSQLYRTTTPVKGNKASSQASTISHNASIIDSYRTQYPFSNQTRNRPNKLQIPQHKSDVKRMLFKDDLNQTQTSQPPIELVL
ncbi:unnamed protein product [Paramecium octaurelia]|uniref:Protein kinase domain-containing protein n=1 Tax=Paramecium octaurelia TaxID=43137 RepID=A0A8S1WPP9_PAROT|nr:unnamed protein product [Paramecium octaurelia]